MVEIAARFMDKAEQAAAAVDDDEHVGGEELEMEPVEPMLEPSDDAGPVAWPMPDFCPLTIDGAVKESFLETLRKEKEQGDAEQPPGEPEAALSPDSRPSSSKRPRAGTASPSSMSPYRNMMQVFQQCRQDVT